MTPSSGIGATAAPTIIAWAIKEERQQRMYKILPRMAGLWFVLAIALIYVGYCCVRVQIQEVQE